MTRWFLLLIVIISAVLGDLLQSHEMKQEGGTSTMGVLGVIGRRRLLALSIVCMAVSFFAFLALVQREPVSFAVPASAGTFVVETFLAKLVLHEEIDRRRAAGTLLVLGGIVLLAV
jgi:drug/metabolite transporter (DMT)-like permease